MHIKYVGGGVRKGRVHINAFHETITKGRASDQAVLARHRGDNAGSKRCSSALKHHLVHNQTGALSSELKMPAKQQQLRVDPADGKAYPLDSVVDFYGENAGPYTGISLSRLSCV